MQELYVNMFVNNRLAYEFEMGHITLKIHTPLSRTSAFEGVTTELYGVTNSGIRKNLCN